MMTNDSRNSRYRRLVRQRHADTSLAKYGFTNPGDTPYNSKHLGSFAYWAGDLYAQLVIVLTDWRNLTQYLDQRGEPASCTALPDNSLRWERPANGFLWNLLKSVGYDIGLPQAPKSAGVFLADAVPFVGMGTVSMHARKSALKHCTAQYLVPLLDIIEPRVVIAVGAGATNALFQYYSLSVPHVVPLIDPPNLLARMYFAPFEIRDGKTALFPVFHPGHVSQRMRGKGYSRDGFTLMLRDWERIKEWMGY